MQIQPIDPGRPQVTYNDGVKSQVVDVPFMQTLSYALLTWAGAFLALCLLWYVAHWASVKIIDPYIIPVIFGQVDFTMARDIFGWWFLPLVVLVPLYIAARSSRTEFRDRQNHMLWWLESIFGDMNGDGVIGEPREALLLTEIKDPDTGNFIRGEIRHGDDLINIIREWSNDNLMKWGYRDLHPLGLSEVAWREIILDMTHLGLLELKYPNNPNSTSVLTAKGQEWMRQAADDLPRLRVQLKGEQSYADKFVPLPPQVNALDVAAPPPLARVDIEKTQPTRTHDDRQTTRKAGEYPAWHEWRK